MLFSAAKIIDDEQQTVGFVCVPQDISYRKQYEANLRASESALENLNETLEQRISDQTEQLQKDKQFIESIIATIPSILMVIDRDNQVISCNQKFVEYFRSNYFL